MLKPFSFFDNAQHFSEPNMLISNQLIELCDSIDDAPYTHELFIDYLRETENPKHWKAARSELNIFMYWCFLVEGISVCNVRRQQLRKYIEFCQRPPAELIGTAQRPHFLTDGYGIRELNEKWRPFIKRAAKSSDLDSSEVPYSLSPTSIKNKLSILSGLFTFLIDCEYLEHNPAMALLKKTGRSLQQNGVEKIKCFSEIEYRYILETAHCLADEDPDHERLLFTVSLLFGLYPRMSEISARPSFSPMMSQFRLNLQTSTLTYYIPRSKHGRSRHVSVSDDVKQALIRYRRFLGLSGDLPGSRETTPLLVRKVASKHGRDAGIKFSNIGEKQLWTDIQYLQNRAAERLLSDGFEVEANNVKAGHPHMYRHTGISFDVNLHNRPIQHVSHDAGHSSVDTTSQYLWTTDLQRYSTTKDKKLHID